MDKALDSFTQLGAQQLASNIAEYWREKGYAVAPQVQRVEGRGGVVTWAIVLPGFVNGLPPADARLAGFNVVKLKRAA
jgi:hypothetical protein